MQFIRSIVVSAVALVPSAAFAADFETDGTFRYDPKSVAILDFEEDVFPDEGGNVSLSVEDPDALSGKRILTLGPFQGVDRPLDRIPEGAQLVRASAWVRGEVIVDVEIRYADNAHAGIDELAVLFPTGRMTSDGWVEVANDHIWLDASRGPSVTVGLFSPAGSSVDAFELTPLRALESNERSGQFCAGSSDPVCGPQQACVFSQCRYVGGWVPSIPQNRDDVARYLAERMQLLFGPTRNRERDLPLSLSAMERMQDAQNPWEYWNAFMLGVRRLHDGHTTTNGVADFVMENEKPLGVCFIEGDADWSHQTAPKDFGYLDVLVSHVGADRNLGLAAGDRLVSVDGVHPIAWARAQTEHYWPTSPTSNHRTFAELAEQMRSLIARFADRIEVIRCSDVTQTCGNIETISISELAPIQEGEAFNGTQCDNRPLRHLADSPASHGAGGTVFHGLVNESDAVEGIHGVEWNSLYTTGNDGVAPGLKAAIAEVQQNGSAIIFDHRSGNGGTILAPQIIWNFAVAPRHVSLYLDRQRAEDELLSKASGLSLFNAGVAANFTDKGGTAQHTTMPVALLITRDVSASDWLPLGLKNAGPNVRIFGPFETNGGFSTRYAFGYWLGMNYVMAVGETYDHEGLARGALGVEPDQIVLPLQSDLVYGIDTVFDVALAWVRQELP